MRLNMWMIKNQLEGLEIKDNLKDSSEQNLRSARLVYAPNCACIRKSGKNTVCYCQNESITMFDITPQYGFELVQGIFDCYNDWYSYTVTAAAENDWQRIIDLLYRVIRQPIVFFDLNNRVIGMADAGEEVDAEWEYLKKNRRSSIDMMRVGFKNMESSLEDTLMYQPCVENVGMICGTYNVKLVDKGQVYGYISVMEMNRHFNDGDKKLLLTLAEIVSAPYALYCSKIDNHMALNSLYNFIVGAPVSNQMLIEEFEYFNIKPSSEFYLIAIAFAANPEQENEYQKKMVKKAIVLDFTLIPMVEVGNFLIILCESQSRYINSIDRALNKFSSNPDIKIYESQICVSVDRLSYCYKQITYLSEVSAGNKGYWIRFKDHALEYFIHKTDRTELLEARHTLVKRLEKTEKDKEENLLNSLIVYLQNERSLTNAAKKMYIHKNTLLYRIKKIMAMYNCNLDDYYEREYILFSYKITQIFGNSL